MLQSLEVAFGFGFIPYILLMFSINRMKVYSDKSVHYHDGRWLLGNIFLVATIFSMCVVDTISAELDYYLISRNNLWAIGFSILSIIFGLFLVFKLNKKILVEFSELKKFCSNYIGLYYFLYIVLFVTTPIQAMLFFLVKNNAFKISLIEDYKTFMSKKGD